MLDIQLWCVLKSWENEKLGLGSKLQEKCCRDVAEKSGTMNLGNYLREQSSIIYVCQDKSNPQHRN